MCSTTAFMLMHSLPFPTLCGGIGVSAIHGDGNRLGILAVGMVLAIGMAGILHTTTIITTTIRTMHGVAEVAIGAVDTDGMVLLLSIRAFMPADTKAVIGVLMLLLMAIRAVEYPVLQAIETAVIIMSTLFAQVRVV